jgi:hypothetical protein
MVYTPSSALPDPTPEPGYVYRWIATHVLGQADPTNVSKKMREGWEPVKAADHPELMLRRKREDWERRDWWPHALQDAR